MARRYSRKKIYRLRHPNCFFCGNPKAHVLDAHRIIPGAEGGKYIETNMLSICSNCHRDVHEGVIVIDPRKYSGTRGGVFTIHYWKGGEEFWKAEE
jgi:5-methylcytosine-specific restriction endonuclease McrA